MAGDVKGFIYRGAIILREGGGALVHSLKGVDSIEGQQPLTSFVLS